MEEIKNNSELQQNFEDLPLSIPDFEVTFKGCMLLFLVENKNGVEKQALNFNSKLTIYAAKRLGLTVFDCILLYKLLLGQKENLQILVMMLQDF